ncbi:unnamed protein product, partial [Amoebophrya sp. A25]
KGPGAKGAGWYDYPGSYGAGGPADGCWSSWYGPPGPDFFAGGKGLFGAGPPGAAPLPPWLGLGTPLGPPPVAPPFGFPLGPPLG